MNILPFKYKKLFIPIYIISWARFNYKVTFLSIWLINLTLNQAAFYIDGRIVFQFINGAEIDAKKFFKKI